MRLLGPGPHDLRHAVARRAGGGHQSIQRYLGSDLDCLMRLHLCGDGVIWAPADDFCRASELLVEDRAATSWGLRGRIMELEARHSDH